MAALEVRAMDVRRHVKLFDTNQFRFRTPERVTRQNWVSLKRRR